MRLHPDRVTPRDLEQAEAERQRELANRTQWPGASVAGDVTPLGDTDQLAKHPA